MRGTYAIHNRAYMCSVGNLIGDWGGLREGGFELGFLKGISIIVIVVIHYVRNYITGMPAIVSKLSSFGGAGFHGFIFCSGFSLWNTFLDKHISWKIFYKKRILKVYIPYLIAVLVSSMCPFMYSGCNRFSTVLSHVFF